MSRTSTHGPVETLADDLPEKRRPGRATAAFVIALALHLALFAVLLRAAPEVVRLKAAVPVAVRLARPDAPRPRRPRPKPSAPGEKPAGGAPAAEAAARVVANPTPPSPRPAARPVAGPAPLPAAVTAPSPFVVAGLTPGELAGARSAGEGEGGGGEGGAGAGGGSGAGSGAGCSMLRRLQEALRRNAKVQAAAATRSAEVGGRPVVVWRDGWVQSAGEDGRGLAGVRQAITLEIAFAPEACRAETLHGFVLIPMAAGPGAPRLALGAPSWRWSDLLEVRRGA